MRDAEKLDAIHADIIQAVNHADNGVVFSASLIMVYLDLAHQLDPELFGQCTRVILAFVKKRFPDTWPAKCEVLRTVWAAMAQANLPSNGKT